jgi:hypothetical protein
MGSSLASAWGLIYIGLFSKSAIASRKVGPMLSLGYVTWTTGMYLNEFVSS